MGNCPGLPDPALRGKKTSCANACSYVMHAKVLEINEFQKSLSSKQTRGPRKIGPINEANEKEKT